MFDYRGIEALYAVLEQGNFERAAQKLHITQSAVSQRIKALETQYGEPVIIRTIPYTTTKLGECLIGHFKQVRLLESSLEQRMGMATTKPRISIAINRDSLETWFLDVAEEAKVFDAILLEVLADDQERTLDYLRKGLVSACLSTSSKPIVGGNAVFLGDMDYVLVCSPEYAQRYFARPDETSCFAEAVALKFDRNDYLHENYLENFFHLKGVEINYQIIPSVKGFKKYALLGYGYALIPKVDILEELAQGHLVTPFPKKVWKVPLYWHHWTIESRSYQQFNASIVKHAKEKLVIPPFANQ